MPKLNKQRSSRFTSFALVLATASICLIYLSLISSNYGVDCAPTTGSSSSSSTGSNNSKNNNRIVRPGLLSNLFRRQTQSTSGSENSSDDAEEAKTQTEIDAQKFMDSLPNAGGSSNQGPSSFRERVSDTFGLLREGMSNHFRSMRENFSDTVEDLRDTWSSGSQE